MSRLTSFICLGFCLLLTSAAHAQHGKITGKVSDSQGGILPGATVVSENVDTGLGQTLVTNAAGEVTVPDLPDGTLTITATKTGYAANRVVQEIARKNANPSVAIGLLEGFVARGRVIDQDGKPVVGAQFELNPIRYGVVEPTDEAWAPNGSATTDAEGRFKVPDMPDVEMKYAVKGKGIQARTGTVAGSRGSIEIHVTRMDAQSVERLDVLRAEMTTAGARYGAATAASVRTNASIVAILGSIIPEPLAMPATVTGHPSTSAVTIAVFAKVSVVRMASAASARPFASSSAAAARMPPRIRGMGRRSPITPVDATNTCSGGTPIAFAARCAISLASRRPCSPMATFAMPLLTTTARACPSRMWARHSSTGAPTTEDVVKTPAALAGTSLAISARSSPVSFTPQWTPAARNPGTQTATGDFKARLV